MKDMRLLKLYNRLLKNDDIDVEEYAKENGVSTRTVERDIKCIKDFLADNEDKSRELIRIKRKKKYQLSYSEDSVNLTKSEILAISKILLASRAFLKDEISLIIDKIVKQCGPGQDLDLIQELLKNEKFHYIELQHKKSFITHIWKLGQAIKDRKKVEIAYKKMDGNMVRRVIDPVGLMFSEYYFYLLAHIENIDKEKYFCNKDDLYPTIYRLDRIEDFQVLNEKYTPTLYKNELHPKSWTQDWRCSFFVSKLTREDKIKIYERRKNGETIPSLAKAFNVQESNIKYLIALIKKHGYNILREDKNRVYSKDFKLQTINRILINHESINSVAIDIGLTSSGILDNWLSKFKENGYNVVEKKKGRKPKSMTKLKKNDKTLSEKEKIKQLEDEILYLKAENEYLKKLRALVQERELKEKKK